ncbi:MAG: DUF924 family protein [Acidobacteriota bacterium]
MQKLPSEDRIEDVSAYWFGELQGGWSRDDRTDLWWFGDENTDEEIRRRFGSLHEAAVQGRLQSWADSAEGRLALIIVLDQFSRNLHRETAAAFETDPKSLELCLGGIERGHDLELPPVKRAFLYMPLMHSESMEHHERARPLYDSLVEIVDEAKKPEAEKMVFGANLHKEIIAEFGRYPHRNRALGRPSTPEEIAYLEADAETFGQD